MLFESFEKDAFRRNERLCLAVSGAGDAETDRQGACVTWQADDPDVMAEVLPAELGAHTQLPSDGEHLLLQRAVAKSASSLVALLWQPIKGSATGQLDRLQGLLGGKAPDDDGKMIGRTGRGSKGRDLFRQEGSHLLRTQKRCGLLEEEGLVGAPPALGHEEQAVVGASSSRYLDLRGQVAAGVLLLIQR